MSLDVDGCECKNKSILDRIWDGNIILSGVKKQMPKAAKIQKEAVGKLRLLWAFVWCSHGGVKWQENKLQNGGKWETAWETLKRNLPNPLIRDRIIRSCVSEYQLIRILSLSVYLFFTISAFSVRPSHILSPYYVHFQWPCWCLSTTSQLARLPVTQLSTVVWTSTNKCCLCLCPTGLYFRRGCILCTVVLRGRATMT